MTMSPRVKVPFTAPSPASLVMVRVGGPPTLSSRRKAWLCRLNRTMTRKGGNGTTPAPTTTFPPRQPHSSRSSWSA